MELEVSPLPRGNFSYFEALLNQETGRELLWWRGDVLRVSLRGKETLVVLVGWSEECPSRGILLSDQVCVNVQGSLSERVTVTRLSDEIFPLTRCTLAAFESPSSQRSTEEVRQDVLFHMTRKPFHPVTEGTASFGVRRRPTYPLKCDIIPIPTENGLLEMKVMQCAPQSSGCTSYRSEIEVPDTRIRKHSTKSARNRVSRPV
jgi:hypothetical protein